MTSYTRLMFFDSDVLFFDESPDYIFEHPNASSAEFVALWEERDGFFNVVNWKDGINAHMMLMRPSAQRFENLLSRAKSGNYRPFTNTEQDVIEAEFAPTAKFFLTGERHIHGTKPSEGGGPAGLLTRLRDRSNEVGVLKMPHHWQ